jgi:predicted outer membrane protein
MLRRKLFLTTGFALPLGVARQVLAQSSLVPDPTPRLPAQPGQGLAVEDVRSLQRAARLSDAQAEGGRLAAGKAASAEIRQLATRTADDHARFRRSLGDIAAARQVDLPDRAAAGIEDRSLAALHAASDEAFDRAFLAWQLGLYRLMAEVYQTMASNSPDTALSRFGIIALAAARAHFETARTLAKPLGLNVDTIGNPPQY